MTQRWARGEAEIHRLIESDHLQRVSGSAADGQALLRKAETTLATASSIAAQDPDSCFVLAYDAARHAASALLAQQGLRATSRGGHFAVEIVLRSQFHPIFRAFGPLRRRRNELEYPERPGEGTSQSEAQSAVVDARVILDSAHRLINDLTIF